MADRTYLILGSEVTGAMDALATSSVTSKTLKVASADVATFEALLPTDEEKWMSGETASTTFVEGYQSRGILLPKKAVNG